MASLHFINHSGRMTNSQDEVSSADKILSPEIDADDRSGDSQPCFRAESQEGDRNETARLNVGGKHYKISRDALMRYEGSMLASLVSDKWKEADGEDEIFIDRDGCHFKYILDYIRSDRVYVSNLSELSALKLEFDYFGIEADMSKVSVKDDFETIIELVDEIAEHEATIEQKKKKIAVIKESYRLANDFSSRAETQGLYLRHNIGKDVDKELLRSCLQSRGLHVVTYGDESGVEYVDICTIGRKDKHVKKDDPNES